MTIEEKSKRFDEALAIAKECITHVHDDAVKKYIFSMFPELKENEGERIKGAIIHFISHTPTVPNGVIGKKTMLAWLEKQGEHKPTEWSKEDEKKRNLLIDILNVNHPNGYFKVNSANTLNMEAIHTEELVDWLKSLRPKKQWLPTVEQAKALSDTIRRFDLEGNEPLSELKEQISQIVYMGVIPTQKQ